MVLVVVAAACGGDETAETTTAGPTTTAASTTTTAPTTTTTEPTTTTTEQGPVAPLTGLPVDDEAALSRPALILKIDNHPDGRPQVGIGSADLVFDVRAEGVTRFMAVFNSTVPDVVGPVRSSRTSDFDIISGFDYPLYGSSGGNDHVVRGLADLPIQAVTATTRREYFRDASRSGPHNLFVRPADLLALANEQVGVPQPWFTYLTDGTLPPTAVPVDGEVTVAFTGGPTAGFSWDEGRQGWLRTQSGSPHLTADGTQIAPANVVIMETSYGVSPADAGSPEVRSTGSGAVVVLTAGHAVAGTWGRATASDKPTLLDAGGDPISLTPGQTWILYPEPGQTSY